MVKFDDGQTRSLIKKQTLFKNLALTAFLAALCCGLAAAAAAQTENYAAVTALLVLAGAAAVCAAAFAAVRRAATGKLNESVCAALARAMYENEAMLKGGGEVAFTAAYSGGNLTLSRKSSPKEIVFDLSGLKKSPSIYSAFGTRLTEFLEGYYAKSGNACTRVTVTDETGSRPQTFTVADKDKAVAKPKKNYFIERGLIK